MRQARNHPWTTGRRWRCVPRLPRRYRLMRALCETCWDQTVATVRAAADVLGGSALAQECLTAIDEARIALSDLAEATRATSDPDPDRD